MSERNHPIYRRTRSALLWGLLAISITLGVLFWPNPRRQIERQVLSMAESISHHGSTIKRDWLSDLSANIHENCSNSTTVTVEGVINEALTQERIIEAVIQIATGSSELLVKLDRVTVELSDKSKRAQVNADALVEVAHDNEVDRERRHVLMTLQAIDGKYRLVSVEATNIVN